jgi:hypothetical protein
MKKVPFNFLKCNLHNLNHIIRIGSIRDGGYFVTKRMVENSTFLISAGISYNAEFERDFKNINPNCRIIMIDGSYNFISYFLRPFYWFFFKKSYKSKISSLIDMILLKNEEIFIKKFIGTPSGISLSFLIDKYIDEELGYLKMDIEGSEYGLLDEIINFRRQFNGISIEFHNVPEHIDEINNFISSINMGLIGLKINEIGGLAANGIPNTIELCFSALEFINPNEYDLITGKQFSNDSSYELLIPCVNL